MCGRNLLNCYHSDTHFIYKIAQSKILILKGEPKEGGGEGQGDGGVNNAKYLNLIAFRKIQSLSN